MTPIVRQGVLDDRDVIVELHQQAFAGSMGASLGRAYLRRFIEGFFEEPAFALVADLDGSAVGYVVARPVDSGRAMRLAPWVGLAVARRPNLLRRSDIRAELRRHLGSLRKSAVPKRPLEPTTCSLTGIGVVESARRLGVAKALLDSYEDEARRRGFREGRLTVYRTNDAARLAYERAGWHKAEPSESDATLVYRKCLLFSGDEGRRSGGGH